MGLVSLNYLLLKCPLNTLRDLEDFSVFLEPCESKNSFRKREFLSEPYFVNLRNLCELVACHQAEGYRCVCGEKARQAADGDSVWVPLTYLAVFSRRYFIRNIPWGVQTTADAVLVPRLFACSSC